MGRHAAGGLSVGRCGACARHVAGPVLGFNRIIREGRLAEAHVDAVVQVHQPPRERVLAGCRRAHGVRRQLSSIVPPAVGTGQQLLERFKEGNGGVLLRWGGVSREVKGYGVEAAPERWSHDVHAHGVGGGHWKKGEHTRDTFVIGSVEIKARSHTAPHTAPYGLTVPHLFAYFSVSVPPMAVPMTPATAAGVAVVPSLRAVTPFASSTVATGGKMQVPKQVLVIGAVVAALLIIVGIVLLAAGKGTNQEADLQATSGNKPAPPKQRIAWAADQAPGAGLIEVDEARAMQVLAGAGGPALLMVHTAWCGACKHAKPGYEAAGKEAQDVRFLGVNGDQALALRAAHKVTGYPTIFGIRADGKVLRFAGARNKEGLLDFAAKLKANTAV